MGAVLFKVACKMDGLHFASHIEPGRVGMLLDSMNGVWIFLLCDIFLTFLIRKWQIHESSCSVFWQPFLLSLLLSDFIDIKTIFFKVYGKLENISFL